MSTTPTYLVLGAAGGIGSELSRTLSRHGRVALLGRDPDKLARLAEGIPGETLAIPADARSFDEVDAAFGTVLDRWGRLNGVANCVGSVLLKPAHLTRAEEFDEVVATNLGSGFATVRSAGKHMARAGGGSVVLVSTAAVRLGLPNHEAIAAAKGGLEGLVRAAAATYGAKGLRVNAVAPGLTETPLTERITSNERARAHSLSLHAAGRLGTARDVASVIAMLLDPANSWITGQVVGVDGGLGSVRA